MQDASILSRPTWRGRPSCSAEAAASQEVPAIFKAQDESVESVVLLTQLALASPASPTPKASPLLSMASSASSSSHLGLVACPASMSAATTTCGDLLRAVARMLDER